MNGDKGGAAVLRFRDGAVAAIEGPQIERVVLHKPADPQNLAVDIEGSGEVRIEYRDGRVETVQVGGSRQAS